MEERVGTLLRGCLMLLVVSQGVCILEQRSKHRGTPMHKVHFTQKGYIQFLRWELPVPELTEFTFCLWIKSDDLAHPHSVFSYSKDERDRLVRAWISSHGRSVHLEIGGIEVFVAPTDIHENRWYHLCQSWENQAGRYALWVNGQLWVQGRSEETVGHVIPSKGDIVLAQEYTDFDKGLEEGIEGTVLGFNLVLASAFDPLSHDSKNTLPPVSSHPITPMFTKISPKPVPRSIIFGERILPLQPHRPGRSTQALNSRFQSKIIVPWHEDELQEVPALKHEPLGLQLVKLSYVRCEIGRGSPFIGGKLMLISWTRTPVRVFGGATVKNANSKCGDF